MMLFLLSSPSPNTSHEGIRMQNDASDRETLHAEDADKLAALWQDIGGSD